jgi:hypothetical protein
MKVELVGKGDLDVLLELTKGKQMNEGVFGMATDFGGQVDFWGCIVSDEGPRVTRVWYHLSERLTQENTDEFVLKANAALSECIAKNDMGMAVVSLEHEDRRDLH